MVISCRNGSNRTKYNCSKREISKGTTDRILIINFMIPGKVEMVYTRNQVRQPGRIGYATPPFSSTKAYFAAFQCWEFTSGEEAAPTAPIPVDLPSGAIVNKGTEV
jgi:hypothetical protein